MDQVLPGHEREVVSVAFLDPTSSSTTAFVSGDASGTCIMWSQDGSSGEVSSRAALASAASLAQSRGHAVGATDDPSRSHRIRHSYQLSACLELDRKGGRWGPVRRCDRLLGLQGPDLAGTA